MYQPLAELLRPKKLSEVIGQSQLIGIGKPLSILTKPQSMILWGPPGVGKTSIANILISSWDAEVIKLSAVFCGIKEIKDALNLADSNRHGLFAKQTVLFIDEIHRFNKAQQDAFLQHLEEGRITLIGATTENPSFELNSALLSRMQVYVLNSLTKDELSELLQKAINNINVDFTSDASKFILDLADGDARRLLNIVESVANCGLKVVDKSKLEQLLPNSWRRFDKGGDEIYNQISALHKSVRGSNPDASLYWLCRILDGGADPLYLGRRILRMAYEDIGLADTNAAIIVNNALQTFERLGSPEGELAIAAAVIYLAVTPKSNSIELAYNSARDFIKQDITREVPIHLRNAPTKFMSSLGYGKEYKYAHDYPNHYVPNENYWPQSMEGKQFYHPTLEGMEKRIIERIKFLHELDQPDNETK